MNEELSLTERVAHLEAENKALKHYMGVEDWNCPDDEISFLDWVAQIQKTENENYERIRAFVNEMHDKVARHAAQLENLKRAFD